jgi:4-aminobutyrate aminotransferase-like enzyme
VEEDDLRTNAAVVGGHFRQKLEELQEKHPLIGDVRGMGLMQALELVEDRTTKQPSPARTNLLMEEARKRGLLVGKGGFHGNVIRMSPPLNIAKADVDEAVRILDESFAVVTK